MNKNVIENFKNNKYVVVNKVVSKETIDFIYNYFLLKREVVGNFFETRYISPFTKDWGFWEDPQVPNTYSHYADIAMETLLIKLMPDVEKITNLKLNPNYSYARIYKKGDVLHRHKDRFSCEISTTLNLGGDPWPIYIDPTGSDNIVDYDRKIIKQDAPKGLKVDLNPGDMLIYRGMELEHWREPFTGENCAQVFLHYNNLQTPGANENIYDRRPGVGFPDYFKKK